MFNSCIVCRRSHIIPKITARAWAAAMMYISELDSEFPDRPRLARSPETGYTRHAVR